MTITPEQAQEELKRRAAAELEKRGVEMPKEYQIDDIPLDPNKILRAIPSDNPPSAFRESLQPKQEPYPSPMGMLTQNTLGGRIIKKAPQIAGGTIGGALGAMIPSIGEEPALTGIGAKIGQWVTAPLGAALGGAAGRAFTLNPKDPNYGTKLLFAALEEGGGEYAGRIISSVLGKTFLRPFRHAVVPGAEEADIALRQAGRRTMTVPGIQPQPKTIIGKTKRGVGRTVFNIGERLKDQPGAAYRLGKEYGAHLLPGQATESFMDTFQAVAEGSFFKGGAVRRFQTQTQQAALENLQKTFQVTVKRNLIKDVGNEKALAILADMSNADYKAFQAIERSLYQTIDELADETIDISSLQKLAEGYTGKGLKPGARERMMRQVIKKPSQQSFEELKMIRSDAWQEYEKFIRAGEKNNARMAKDIALGADNLMEQMAGSKGGAVQAAWRTADEFHKGGLRVKWIADTFAKYSKADDAATGKGFVNYIAKMAKEIEGRPSELARMGFRPEEINRLRQVAAATRFASERAVGGGRMLVQIAQGSAIVQIAGIPVAAAGLASDKQGLTAGGIGMIIGPTLMAQMILSPTGSKLLSTGLTAPAGSRSIGTLGARILREASYHEIERRMKGEPPQLWLRYISQIDTKKWQGYKNLGEKLSKQTAF